MQLVRGACTAGELAQTEKQTHGPGIIARIIAQNRQLAPTARLHPQPMGPTYEIQLGRKRAAFHSLQPSLAPNAMPQPVEVVSLGAPVTCLPAVGNDFVLPPRETLLSFVGGIGQALSLLLV